MHSVQDDAEKDFDLRPWLESAACAGSRPATSACELRDGVAGCPYLDLPGERRRRYIEGPDTWLAV